VLRPALIALLLLFAVPATASAAPLQTPCTGTPITPDQVITGEFDTSLSKSFVMVPFDVPKGTTAIRVKYCWDRPEGGTLRHTLDLGLYEPLHHGSSVWGPREFRGWGGSSHPDVTVSAEGFSTEEQYRASPRIDPPGKTTRAFLPGPIRAGRWAAELGVAAVIPQSDGDSDGKVGWRVEIDLADDPAFADEPYRPTHYSRAPVSWRPGWYQGDFHVHAEHSALGDATMTDTFDYAFKSVAEGGAGLDFITLSDYVSGSAWGEIGRYQPLHPGKLIIRSAEVITYRGHTNNHGSGHFVDYREGPIYVWQPGGPPQLARGSRDPSELFAEVHMFGGWTQINHPTIFPPVNATAASFCRGCFWEYSDQETDWSQVDAYEVATGPADIGGTTQNPFTPTAIAEYERILGLGYKLAAVGSSDSHDAGYGTGAFDAPIGEARTVVYASDLSERGIRCGVKARHTYVKVAGAGAPDLRFKARPWGPWWWRDAIVGDVVRAPGATFKARVVGGAGRQLLIVKDGATVATVPVTGDDFVYRFKGAAPGRWRIQLMRGQFVDTVSSPIWVEPGWGGAKRSWC
jgi:hypothetical protein